MRWALVNHEERRCAIQLCAAMETSFAQQLPCLYDLAAMPRLLATPLLLLLALSALGQKPNRSKYRLELLSMIRSDSTRGFNDIQASILITPIKDKDWPPILRTRIGHRINERDSITYLDIQGQGGPQVVLLTVYDRSVAEKNVKLYARIRAKLDQVKDEEVMILWFEFRNLSEEAIRKIAITYGPWEKNDNTQRVEETFFMEFTE